MIKTRIDINTRQLRGRIAYILLFFSKHIYNSATFNLPISRKEVAELRPVTSLEISQGAGRLASKSRVSISQTDLDTGSPKTGDMIARNPKNHNDQWLIAVQYFKDNFELV